MSYFDEQRRQIQRILSTRREILERAFLEMEYIDESSSPIKTASRVLFTMMVVVVIAVVLMIIAANK